MHFSEREKPTLKGNSILETTEAIHMICQLYKVSSTRDGGSRIVLDCGSESLDAVQKIQKLNAMGDVNLALAIVPCST